MHAPALMQNVPTLSLSACNDRFVAEAASQAEAQSTHEVREVRFYWQQEDGTDYICIKKLSDNASFTTRSWDATHFIGMLHIDTVCPGRN